MWRICIWIKLGLKRIEGDMSRGYCCFKSILCGSHNYLVPIHKMIKKNKKGDFKQILQVAITIIIVLVIVAGRTFELGSIFSSFISCPSLTSVPIPWSER